MQYKVAKKVILVHFANLAIINKIIIDQMLTNVTFVHKIHFFIKYFFY